MIIWIAFWIVVTIIGLEMFSFMLLPKKVLVRCESDMDLVEPGETVTLTYEARNAGIWAISYGAISICFDEQIEVREDEGWCRKHVSREWTGVSINHHFLLLPHRCFKGKVRVAFPARGVHKIDRMYFESGDMLGFKAVVTPCVQHVNIICTCPIHEDMEEQRVLGGTLGDISVRRFIFEDPNLITGYQDYTGREPMKQISWVRTARTGQLMVKQNDYTADADVAVMVNMESRDKLLLEECLKLTRTVCEQLEQMNVPYLLMSNGDLQDLPVGLGKRHLHLILRRIGTSRLAHYNSFESLADRGFKGRQNNRSYVIITPERSEEQLAVINRMKVYSEHRLITLFAGDYSGKKVAT